jgi:hypothetical protein
LKAALEAANAEKNDSAVDYSYVGQELETSLASIAKMYIELMDARANLAHVTSQLRNKVREYDAVGLELLGVTTKYRDTLITIKANQQQLAMMASELAVARNMLSETALFAELMKEELFEMSTNLMESNEDATILNGMAILKDMQSTIEDEKKQKKSLN